MSTRPVRQRLRRRLARQLQWLIAIRLLVVTSMLVPAYLVELGADPLVAEFTKVVRYAGLTYLASLIYLLFLRVLGRKLVAQAYFQFFGDVLLITFLVHETNGVDSAFSMLYLVVISVASVLLQRRAGLTIAGVAWVLYAGVIFSQQQGWLGSDTFRAEGVLEVAYALIVHLLGFFGVAFLTSYLGRDAARMERELVETAESLAELEVLHRDVIESMTSGLITTDLDGRIISINPAGCEILRVEAVDLVDRQVFESQIMTRQQWELLHDLGDLNDFPRAESEVSSGEESLWIGYRLTELKDFGGDRRGYTLIFQDLTDTRRLAEQLRMKDRMAAVGNLAAGLAHEIGNPLAAISGSVQMLSNAAPKNSSQSKLLDIILQESQRLDRTIKSFLSYARPTPRHATVFDVATKLDENLKLFRNSDEVGPRHQLEIQLDPSNATIEADPDQISQIFWNLARNAVRAMPKGGILRVSGQLNENHYTIGFEDTGKGMTEDERTRLFHPFQSFFDGGTGIGMAIVYRIVDEHDGRILVDSQVGEGTRIEIELPLGAGKTERAHQQPGASVS